MLPKDYFPFSHFPFSFPFVPSCLIQITFAMTSAILRPPFTVYVPPPLSEGGPLTCGVRMGEVNGPNIMRFWLLRKFIPLVFHTSAKGRL